MTTSPLTASSPAAPAPAPATSATPDWIAPGEQGFLVGETLYLRPPEAADAKFPLAWHDSPYPLTTARAEKVIEEDQPKSLDQRRYYLIACRRSDDQPVGSCRVSQNLRHAAFVEFHANPGPGHDPAPVIAEILRIVVPWLSNEFGHLTVWAVLDAAPPAVKAAAEAVGMRPAIRLREAIWRDGVRHDRWTYELLHPAAIARYGDPGVSIEQETAPPAVVPTVRRFSLRPPFAGPVPPNALMVGERVALRLAEPADAREHSRLLRHETDTAWDFGRTLDSPAQFVRWMKSESESTPPENFTFAVMLRETNALIGLVSLLDVDWFNRTAETGSIIYLPEHRSKGLGSEAKNLMIEYAFDHLNLHLLVSTIWSFNPRSQAAIRKQGYRDAGRYQWLRPGPHGMDYMVVFDLLASEWRARVNATG